jgi:predicted dehydrogenase
MAAFLELVASRRVAVEPLIGERVPIERAPEAYERLLAADRTPLGIVLEYGPAADVPRPSRGTGGPQRGAKPNAVAVIGAGSFATRVLVPGLARAGFELVSVASASGLSARAAADRFGFRRAAAVEEAVADPDVGLVAIATRHASHARLAAAALRAGKAVFVEKPPFLTEAELEDLRTALEDSGGTLAVGFNRRHAPLARELRAFVRQEGVPLDVLYRVNAGALPAGHWANDPEEGGGRLLGEGCHFVDFACWLTGLVPAHVTGAVRRERDVPVAAAQSFAITLEFPDRSLATIVYGGHGSPRLGKEYVEAHAGGRSAVLDDFRSLALFEGGRRRRRSRSSDKGHDTQFLALRRLVESGEEDDPPDPLASMAATLAALRSAERATPVSGPGAAPSTARSGPGSPPNVRRV